MEQLITALSNVVKLYPKWNDIHSGQFGINTNGKLVIFDIDDGLDAKKELKYPKNVIRENNIYNMKKINNFNSFIQLNENITQVPDGGGNTRNPKDTNRSTIWIKGIYFWGIGFTSNEISDKWIEFVHNLDLDLPIDNTDFGVPEISTEDIEVYFHGMEVVIKVRSDKYDLKEFTEMLADKISDFDLPIEVTYSYMSKKY